MGKRWAVIALTVWFFAGRRVFAQELRIRGVLANPSADESTEWIAIENPSNSTISAAFSIVRDTLGKTVEYSLPGVFEPFELRTFSRTQSGITLNNDSEGVELLKNGEVQQRVPVFISPGSDAVWAELGTTWQYLTLSEWLGRAAAKDWQPRATIEPTPSPLLTANALASTPTLELALFSPCTSPEWIEVHALESGMAPVVRVEESSGVIVSQEELEFMAGESKRIEWAGAKLSNSGEWIRVVLPNQEYLFTYQACQGTVPYRFVEGKWQQSELGKAEFSLFEEQPANGSSSASPREEISQVPSSSVPSSSPALPFGDYSLLATTSAKTKEQKIFPAAPLPDFSAEETVFLDWKKHSLLGSLSLVFAGGNFLIVTAPYLWTWYNDHKDPW